MLFNPLSKHFLSLKQGAKARGWSDGAWDKWKKNPDREKNILPLQLDTFIQSQKNSLLTIEEEDGIFWASITDNKKIRLLGTDKPQNHIPYCKHGEVGEWEISPTEANLIIHTYRYL